ncbi:hypothetical protein IW261DRAFT_1576191 [Armillaria novae-zelandiae]|uniref:Uncharacterized protein n=1 Tax=Armillaria novae-zelandiae TaxID=153914 RepID=A0AA39TY17_9AGAR|nr:hypothetical protein IW261DRAFT_1576191 [Armillaria novae-zelandiae]
MSSSSYIPSSDDFCDQSQSPVVRPFGCCAPSRLKNRIERRQAALNSIANKTVQQYYDPGGPLDSQTTETEWVNRLYHSEIITPPRRVIILQCSPQRSQRSITQSNNTPAHGGPTSDVFNVSHPDHLEQGDVTLVEEMGGDVDTKAPLIEPVKQTLTLAEITEDDIPIASSPPPVLALSTVQSFEEYNELVGALGGAQLSPGWSDAPEIPVAQTPSPVHADNLAEHDLSGLECQIIAAIRSLVEDETYAIRECADNALDGHWRELSGLYDAARQQDRYISELLITSKTIAKGYLHYDSSVFTTDVNGSITFRIYTRTSNNMLIWKGRKEDFNQLDSSETMDLTLFLLSVLFLLPGIAHTFCQAMQCQS